MLVGKISVKSQNVLNDEEAIIDETFFITCHNHRNRIKDRKNDDSCGRDCILQAVLPPMHEVFLHIMGFATKPASYFSFNDILSLIVYFQI